MLVAAAPASSDRRDRNTASGVAWCSGISQARRWRTLRSMAHSPLVDAPV
jgi:hypothetical protein